MTTPVEAHLIRGGDIVLDRSGKRRTVATVTVVVEYAPLGSETDKVDEVILMPTAPVLRVGGLTDDELAAVDEISTIVERATPVPQPRTFVA